MLRITVQADAAAAKTYFRQATHDYLAEGEQARPGVWSGRGAALLGLTGEIARGEWDRLCDNRHPQSGSQLTAAMRHPRRIYYDCTWSMPKGCSLASLFDDRVIPAFLRAVEYGNGLIEDDLRVRVRIGGADDDRVTGNAVIGTYLHTDGRPVDGVPDRQVHAHSCFFNATRDGEEGRWKAAQLGYVKAHAGFYEAAMLARFGKELVGMGYGVRRKGSKFFDLEHVPDSLTDKFSNRTRLIERTAAERGITDPAAKARLGAQTRERKQDRFTASQLEAVWVSRLTDEEVALLRSRPWQRAPLPAPAESAGFALGHSFHHEAVVNEKQILEHGLRHGVGAIDLPALKAELNRAGLLVRGERATTREMLRLESEMIRWAERGRGAVGPIGLDPVTALTASAGRDIKPPRLTAGQQGAVRHVLTNTDRVTLVEGKAGTGKTTALEVVAAAVRRAGLPLQALANTHEAVKQLALVDAQARTLAAFLGSPKAQDAVAGGVVILDEASQVSHRDMAALFAALDRTGARLTLVGDRFQHESVAAGAPYRLLMERAGGRVAVIDQIVRQQVPLYRQACEHFARHDVLAGLDALGSMGSIRELDEPDRTAALVQDYLGEVRAGREVVVVAPTHREADHTTERLRAALRADGRLTGEDREVERLVNLNWTDARRAELKRPGSPEARQVEDEGLVVTRWGVYRPGRLAVAVGDELRATGGFRDAAGAAVKTGSRFTVTGFTPAGIRVATPSGGCRVLPPAAGHLAHAYCQTSFSSQSRTVDAVLVAESAASYPAADRAQMYVSASRGRHRIAVYTDSLEDLREAVNRDRKKPNATDLFADREVPSDRATDRVGAWAAFMTRLGGIAAKTARPVLRLAHHLLRETHHEREIG